MPWRENPACISESVSICPLVRVTRGKRLEVIFGSVHALSSRLLVVQVVCVASKTERCVAPPTAAAAAAAAAASSTQARISAYFYLYIFISFGSVAPLAAAASSSTQARISAYFNRHDAASSFLVASRAKYSVY